MDSKKHVTNEDLFEFANKAKENSNAKFSDFHVGAALLTADKKVYTGCNIENYSLSLSICAERVALFKAFSEGEREFVKIAVVSDDGEYCPPCGACRQVLMEFAPEIKVLIKESGVIKEIDIGELLPYPFDRT